MKITTALATGNFWYGLWVAIAIIVGLACIWPTLFQVRDKPHTKFMHFGYFIGAFWVCIIILGGLWFDQYSLHQKRNDWGSSDTKYWESVENVLLAAVAIFVPLLVNMWNAALKDIIDAVKELDDMPKYKQRNIDRLKHARDEYTALCEIGSVFQVFFWLSIGITGLLIAAIHYSRSSLGWAASPVIASLAFLLVEYLILYFFTLLMVHIVVVLPTAGAIQRLTLDSRFEE